MKNSSRRRFGFVSSFPRSFLTGVRERPLKDDCNSSEENLPFLDASDSLSEDGDEQRSCGEGLNFSFLHSVYHTPQSHEEAILFRVQTSASKEDEDGHGRPQEVRRLRSEG